MELTQNIFKDFKKDYDIYRGRSVLDKYNNEELVFDKAFTLKSVMFSPTTDEYTIELFGKSDKELYQAVYYGDEDIRQQDQLTFNGRPFEVVSVLKYQTHKYITIRQVKDNG